MKRVPSLPYIDEAQGNRMTKDSLFAASLLTSVLIHLAALILVSVLMGHQNQFATRSLIPISLLGAIARNKYNSGAGQRYLSRKEIRASSAKASTRAKPAAPKQTRTSYKRASASG
jgi:hypothetical protein